METESEEELREDLVYATAARDIRSIEGLIQAGIDPSTPTKSNGCSALHTASVLESPVGPQIVSRMLYHGANPNIKTPTGLSPLHIAAMWGRYETINVLLDNGANIAIKDSDDMSPLDYAEDAERNKAQCIDALTRYRCNTKRSSGSGGKFMCKSRLNLNKILGGHVEFSTFLSEDSLMVESKQEGDDDTCDRNDSLMSDVTNIVDGYGCHSRSFDLNGDFEHDQSMSQTMNGTLFQTCEEELLSNAITSTLLEPPDTSDLDERPDITGGTLPRGYLGDTSSISSNSHQTTTTSTSASTSGAESNDETFWSVRNSFINSSERDETTAKDDTLPPIRRRKNKNKFFVPLSPSPLSMQIEPPRGEDVESSDTCTKQHVMKNETREERVTDNETRESQHLIDNESREQEEVIDNHTKVEESEEGRFLEETPELHTLNTPEKESSAEEEALIKNMSDLLLNETGPNESLLAAESTVNYSANTSVSRLIDYYEDCNDDSVYGFNPSEESILSESPTKTLKSSHFVLIKCRDEVPQNQRRSFDELSSITVSYDWKDVTLNETTVEVPPNVLALTNMELRDRLVSMGERPGPVSDTTRRVYQKHLMRIESLGGDVKNKKDSRFVDYTYEMRQVLLELLVLSKEKGEDLEQEMSFTFDNPEKHTWREGTQKTSFNYILLDPRVTKNLADRSESMTFMERFRIFVAAIFYIGKGKKSRPYEHFHEAVKYLKNENKNIKASTKVNMILDIWEQGYGVPTLHVFHSVIPVEAYTREACMIETMSLPRLTNAKQGDFYGPAATWGVKKKRLLGIHLLMKAMKIYLIEGERQIKQRDLTK